MSDDNDYTALFVPPSTQDYVEGVLSATVVLVMYGNYQSTQSADVYRLIRVVRRQLSVSLGDNYSCFIFRHFPKIESHHHARRASEAAEAAAVQGQFWQMHDTLFEHQQELENGYLVEYANRLRLDIPQFLQDMSKQSYLNRINEDIEGGLSSGVTAAPALFINGTRYVDRWNIDRLMAAIAAASR